jgi:hypothetical protein
VVSKESDTPNTTENRTNTKRDQKATMTGWNFSQKFGLIMGNKAMHNNMPANGKQSQTGMLIIISS